MTVNIRGTITEKQRAAVQELAKGAFAVGKQDPEFDPSGVFGCNGGLVVEGELYEWEFNLKRVPYPPPWPVRSGSSRSDEERG